MSDQKAILRAIYADKQVGERFEFGHYPQGSNGEVYPITWRVLRCDSDGLFVVSDKVLDVKPFNEKLCYVDWGNCTLRRWLNNEFFNSAFDKDERSLIGFVSLLSRDEALHFFDDEERMCLPTIFALTKKLRCGILSSGEFGARMAAVWWTRDEVEEERLQSAITYCHGFAFNYYDVDDEYCGVRPAIKLIT